MARNKFLGYSLVALLAALVGQGVASAQEPQPPDPAAGLSRQVHLSPQEQVTTADQLINTMDVVRSSVQRELEVARSQRDVVKTLCLNDKLNQIDVALRNVRERRQALEAAASRNDTDLSNHEFTIISVVAQRAAQIDAEAKQCIGKEAGFVGESSTTSDVDVDLPEIDLDAPSFLTISLPPTCASCYK